MIRVVLFLILAAFGTSVAAQDETLADIRQELSVLYVEIQRLKQELNTTGGASSVVGGQSVLERVDLIEAEVARMTALTERLQNRIEQIVADGTNRIGDLEFRLVELEGGDISKLGETTTLGGDVPGETTAVVTTPTTDTGGGEMAVAEEQDFSIALQAYDDGDYQAAAVQFSTFTDTYPVGPLTGEAHFYRGQALTALGDTANAARAYLESFSGSPNNPKASDALLQLGLSLSDLGQMNEACISLQQVPTRYPNTQAALDAVEAAANLGC